MWPIITRNTTQLPTTELCAQTLLHPTAKDQDLLNAQDKRLNYQRGCDETGTELNSRMTSSTYRSRVTGNSNANTIRTPSRAE
eukprot:scaffold65063_cov55-Attheya_sp.AAC.1